MARSDCMGDFPVDRFIVVDCDVAKAHGFFHADGKLVWNDTQLGQHIVQIKGVDFVKIYKMGSSNQLSETSP